MKKLHRRLLLALAAVLALLVAFALALPSLVDANRYRGLIESRAEKALGRDVRLGEIRLSVLPSLGLALDDVGVAALPEEGGGDLVTAARLRVGARLLPLLSGRLEVTSIVLEEPSMLLSRDRDGKWNVEGLVARESPADEAPAGGETEDGGEISIALLRLSGGRLTVRDASGEKPRETGLAELDLELRDFQRGSTSSFELATGFATVPGARIEISGEGDPFAATGSAGNGPRRLAAEVRLEKVTGPLLTDLAALAGLSLEGVIGDRAFDASGRFTADLDDAGSIELSALEVEGADLALSRDRGGRWNVGRIASGAEAPETGGGREVAIDSLRLKGARLALRDDSGAQPLAVVLTGLDVELKDYRAGRASSFSLTTGFESAPGARVEIAGDGPLADAAGRLQADVKVAGLGGKLLARLAAAGGAAIEGPLGERPLDASARLDAELAPGGRVTVGDLKLTGADLELRRGRDGRWNFELPEGPGAADARPLTVNGVTVDGARIRLHDESVGAEPLDLVLDDLRLELDRLPTDGAANLRLTASVEGGGGRADLEIGGRLGPLGEGRQGTPVELSTGVRRVPLAAAAPLLADLAGIRPEAGTADLDLKLSGSFPDAYSAAGALSLAAARIATDERTLDLDLDVRFDVAARGGVEFLDFAALDLTVGGNTLALEGSVEQVDAGRRWDLALAPARVPAADLAALLELLVADFSMSFDSATPVAIEGRARGLQTADRLPDLSGRLELRGFSLRHPSLSQPIEKVDADVAFEGETVRITDLAAAVGGSDLAGELTLAGWERPRVAFDLRSRRADLGEVLSTFESAEASAASGPEGTSLLEHVVADGDLRVASGTWDTLEFTDLSARVKLAGGVMTLDPLDMKLYDGAFDGRVDADLRATPVAFDVRGKAERVDVAPFLAANLEVQNALFGRFTGEVQARGAGADYDAIVKSLTGGGTARIDEGRLGRLDLLATVAKVSGVLGQRTLASLADRIAKQTTRFERLEGKFELADGAMTVTQLILQSPDFGLEGQVHLDLLASTLGGQFQLAFSELLSNSMQREASRAGELFYDVATRRVVMPLGLKGSLEAPAATVDWGGAARGYATRRATQELTGLLAKALGGRREEESAAPPPQAPPRAAAPADALGAEITRQRWGGSVLLQDLKLAGVVRGPRIERAELHVVDADRREIERVDRLPAVDAHLASAADRSAPAEIVWEARVDGKDLVLARFPLRVIVSVFDTAGNSATATATVEK